MSRFGTIRTRIIIAIVFGAIVFISLSLYADYQQTAVAILAFKWWFLLPILCLTLLNFGLRFIKWHYYLRQLGIKVSKIDSGVIFCSGLTMCVTPGKLGELFKSYLLKQLNNTPISLSSPIVIAERLTDIIAIIALALCGISTWRYGADILIICTGLVIFFIGIVSSRTFSEKIINCCYRIPRLTGLAIRLGIAYNSIYQLINWRIMVFTTFVSIISWFCECLGFYLVITGFAIDFPLLKSVFVYAITTLAGAVSMLPGGLGVTEGSMAGLLVLNAVPKELSVAVTVIIRLCTLWFAVCVGGLALLIVSKRVEGIETVIDVTNKEDSRY